MTKLRKPQQNIKNLSKKQKDEGAVRKVVRKKAAALNQKKKETIVSKKDELTEIVTIKKNKIKPILKEEKKKSKADSKKNKSSALIPNLKTENSKSEEVTKKAKKNVKSVVSKEEKHESPVISKTNKSKRKQTGGTKEKKIKSTVISKENKKPIKLIPITIANESKTKVVTKKNKDKSKPIVVPEEVKIVSKVLSKKEKSNLKKVLVPKEEENVSKVISTKNKQKSKLDVVSKKEKNESQIVSKKGKRKATAVLQKENTKPKVALKKAKVSKEANIKEEQSVVEPTLVKEGSKVSINKIKEKVIKNNLKRKDLERYVKALLKVVDTGEQKRKTLFTSEKPPIFLNITCVRIPKTPLHQMRFELPHSMVAPTDDIALFVKDLKKGRRRDFDETIQHYEDLLQKHKCNRIKAVIPINQVKTEYRQFEMRRRLLGSYDHFLCDGRISGHLAHLLGKTFRENRHLPTSVHMDKKDLKEEINRALKKTSLQIHSNGDTYVTQFATCSMSIDEIIDNLMFIIQELSKNFPGGWPNIRCLRIKSPISLAIPIYMTLKNKNETETPVVEPKRPKAYKNVEGELSTFTSNVQVTVTPDGTVDVLNLGGEDEEDLDETKEEDDSENQATELEFKKEAENVDEKEDDDDDEPEESEDEDDEDEDDEDEDDEDEDENDD